MHNKLSLLLTRLHPPIGYVPSRSHDVVNRHRVAGAELGCVRDAGLSLARAYVRWRNARAQPKTNFAVDSPIRS
jgi:hypothetical protein